VDLLNATSSCRSEEWDVVVVGTGLAGLYTALLIADSGKKILLLAKSDISESNTDQAQGGIAASISEQDSPHLHMQDTLIAGSGLCDTEAVRKLVEEGPGGVNSLIEMGVRFDKNHYGIALTREGAHSKRRIVHAKGDSTGRVIREALTAKLGQYPNIIVRSNTFVLDLLVGKEACHGLICLDANAEILCINAAHVVIASGGACRMFQNTTNPTVATGDGIAMAWRAGARLADMEFVQFHPTALLLEEAPRFLISEAVRGEGAHLLNSKKERFMPFYHAQAELAPRDVVARAMVTEIEKSESNFLWLDLSPLAAKDIPNRFPTIYQKCKEYGLNLPQDLIPVSPAAHYFIGGIVTDEGGQTGIPGLYACGEVSCTGVHGANRLASNSLLEALVYGRRIAITIKTSHCPVVKSECSIPELLPALPDALVIRKELRSIMWRFAGLRRDRRLLEQGLGELDELMKRIPLGIYSCRFSMELLNMLTLARFVVQAGLLREESRGGHYRIDFPQSHPSQHGHWVFQRGLGPAFSAIEEDCHD